MENSMEKTSAELQREIDQDRRRIGDRIDAIQERMSPGQLVDEVIAYAKGSGGGEYVSNLGHALKANPLPVALMGVSLAWLMAKGSSSSGETATWREDPEYPLYPATGQVRRIGPPAMENGARYSHFADESGRRLKALTDETGGVPAISWTRQARPIAASPTPAENRSVRSPMRPVQCSTRQPAGRRRNGSRRKAPRATLPPGRPARRARFRADPLRRRPVFRSKRASSTRRSSSISATSRWSAELWLCGRRGDRRGAAAYRHRG